jgi:hypothetical protein
VSLGSAQGPGALPRVWSPADPGSAARPRLTHRAASARAFLALARPWSFSPRRGPCPGVPGEKPAGRTGIHRG